jgi:hypothetical protein
MPAELNSFMILVAATALPLLLVILLAALFGVRLKDIVDALF